jgi:hypothetical protein
MPRQRRFPKRGPRKTRLRICAVPRKLCAASRSAVRGGFSVCRSRVSDNSDASKNVRGSRTGSRKIMGEGEARSFSELQAGASRRSAQSRVKRSLRVRWWLISRRATLDRQVRQIFLACL